MKKIHLLSILVLFLGLSSCQQNMVDAIQPKPSKNAKQARARLMAAPKWAIDEAYENGVIVYKNGVNLSADQDLDVTYVRFKEDGNFEINYKKDAQENLKWEMNETNSILTIYDAANKDYREDWTIDAGSVYSNAFEMSYKYDYTEYVNNAQTKKEERKITLKMKTID